MSITRGPRPETGWYALDRRIAEDARLSWAARGVLLFLLVKPDHWRVSIEHLRKQTEGARITTGRDGIYKILTELQEAGYVTSHQVRLPDGRMGGTEYSVSEVPESPRPPKPYTAEPLPAKTTLDKTKGADETKGIKDLVQLDAAQVAGELFQSPFERFWAAYPNKRGKAASQAKWIAWKLDAIADDIIAHVARMQVEDDYWKRGYIPHGSTYVNSKGWLDDPVASKRQDVAQESGTMRTLREMGVFNGR